MAAPLKNSKHEQFCQAVATGKSPEAAYLAAGYGGKGSAASAARLLKNAKVSARLQQLWTEVAEKSLKVAISDRNKRLELLQDSVDRIGKLIKERGAEDTMQAVPGGSTGLLCRDYKGKDATQAVYRFDAALIEKRNETLKQAAIEEGQWTEKRQLTGTIGIVERLKAARQRVAVTRTVTVEE